MSATLVGGGAECARLALIQSTYDALPIECVCNIISELLMQRGFSSIPPRAALWKAEAIRQFEKLTPSEQMRLAIHSDSPELVRIAMSHKENNLHAGGWKMLELAFQCSSLFALAEMLAHPSTKDRDALKGWRLIRRNWPKNPREFDIQASSLLAVRANRRIPLHDMQKWASSRMIRQI